MSESEATLEETPTWIVASVCSAIVLISLVFERALHHLGKALERRRVTLYEALVKLKEELMLLGFVSLLLVVFQDLIQKICIDKSLMEHWLPCRRGGNDGKHASAAAHYAAAASTFAGGGRRMLKGGAAFGHCSSKGKVPLLSRHALEQLHIFIFVLAIMHVALSASTVLLGLLQMRKWMHWENNIQQEGSSAPKMIKRVQKIKFIQDGCKGHERLAWVIIWMRSFFKQFYGSVSNDDYVAKRLGFVMMVLLNICDDLFASQHHRVALLFLDLVGPVISAASDRGKAGAHHKQAGPRGGHEARRWARGWGRRPAPFRQAVLVPQPPARARPNPLHPVPERVRVRVFHLDTSDVRCQLLHHGQTGVQRTEDRHLRRRPGALQLQHAPPLRHRVPYGEFVQERGVRRRRRRPSQRLGRRRPGAREKICPGYGGSGTEFGREEPSRASPEHLLLRKDAARIHCP